MTLIRFSNRVLAALLIVGLCGVPATVQAWQQPTRGETQGAPAPTPAPAEPVPGTGTDSQPATPPPTQETAPAPTQQGGQPHTGTTVDPSQGPLEPAPSDAAPEALPSAEMPGTTPGEQPVQEDETVVEQLPEKPTPQKPADPLGAATAQTGRTAGGAASKPAGTAIAPAKQRQVRSLLIKIGAIAGAGIALGTVYMLTRKTPGSPPGAAVR
jgi:hypothetical protein